MKIESLGVPEALIRDRTVYDPDVARAMVEGALARSKSAELAIAITGVAGPKPDQGKPVGLVYIATLRRGGKAAVAECHFKGRSPEIVAATIQRALELGLQTVE